MFDLGKGGLDSRDVESRGMSGGESAGGKGDLGSRGGEG